MADTVAAFEASTPLRGVCITYQICVTSAPSKTTVADSATVGVFNTWSFTFDFRNPRDAPEIELNKGQQTRAELSKYRFDGGELK
jgi:hypothetical protein